MSDVTFDPDGNCARAINQLQQALTEEGHRLASEGDCSQALMTLYRAYALRPCNSPLLHGIEAIYQQLGDSAAANDCRRGVVPELVENTLFNGELIQRRLRPARRASSARHLVTHRRERVSLTVPASNADPTLRPEFRARHTESRGSFVSVLDDAHFWFDGYHNLIIDNRGNLLQEHIRGSAPVVADTMRQRSTRVLDGTVCLIDARSSSIYYHWMLDVLPKFALLEAAGIDLDSIDHFVVNCPAGFQQQTLDHIGIPRERTVPVWPAGPTACRRLLVPFLKHDRGDRYYNGLGLGMAAWVPHWLRQRFLDLPTGDTPSNTPGERIYISRDARGSRTPRQESALVDALQSRGFRAVTLEELSVVDQAQLMHRADVVVAPHGAGLTNIAFCRAGTRIFELFDDYVVPCYWALSELSGLNYHAYLADADRAASTAGAVDSSLAARRNRSMDVDVASLMRYLDMHLTPIRQAEAD